MAVIINGSSGVTTPGISNSEGYTGDGLTIAAGAPSGAMTLDASGNLQVGTTTSGGAYATFGNNSASGANRWASVFGTNSASAGNPSSFGLTIGWNYSSGGGENNIIYGTSAGSLTGLAFSSYNGTTVTERARIDSSGHLLVGTTIAYARLTVKSSNEVGSFTDTSGTGLVRFRNSSEATIGYIQWSGSTTSYVTSSDYRLKNTIAPMTGALAKVALLKPVTYKWKADGSDGEGFIAHELAEVVPQCVTGEKDAVEVVDVKDEDGNVIGTEERPVYQGIDTSFLVATLTAAIQELKAELDTVKAELAAMKGTA